MRNFLQAVRKNLRNFQCSSHEKRQRVFGFPQSRLDGKEFPDQWHGSCLAPMSPAYRLGTFNDKERIHGNPRL
ncbi:hypothetical protein ACSEQP_19600, partial [Pseudomonas aeruginosa]